MTDRELFETLKSSIYHAISCLLIFQNIYFYLLFMTSVIIPGISQILSS